MSTAASRAWLAVAIVGLLVVAIVIALQLIPRLTAGQQVIDAARPAMTDTAVKGELAATKLVGAVRRPRRPADDEQGQRRARDRHARPAHHAQDEDLEPARAGAASPRGAAHRGAAARAAVLGHRRRAPAPDAAAVADAEPARRAAAGRSRADVPAAVPDAVGAAERIQRLVRHPRRRDDDALRRRDGGAHDAGAARLPQRRPCRERRRAAGPLRVPRRLGRDRLHPVPRADRRHRPVRVRPAGGAARHELSAGQARVGRRRRGRRPARA